MTITRSNERRQVMPGLRNPRSTTVEKDHLEDSMDEEMGSTNLSEDDMEDGPAEKVRHGREGPSGHEEHEHVAVEGSTVGSGHGGMARARNTMGHGERMSSARHTMGDHDGGQEAEAFNAHGNLGKEHGKVHGQGKS